LLSDRALNRATLARQWLLERRDASPIEAVAWLVGLQAQEPPDPYLALWSRLTAFDPHALGGLLEDRSVVHIVVMRGTIHLVTADDAAALRPHMQPILDVELTRHPDARRVADVSMDEPLALARRLLDEQPRTMAELRAAFAEAFPDAHAAGLAYTCRNRMPLVQVPPRGVWGQKGTVRLAHLETWVGRPLDVTATLDDVVVRYLAAFGPATAADVAAWCRLTGMRPVLDRLGDRVRILRDERGRELFDVPDGLLPPEDVPAPVRFLPEYDNALLSHADRSRFFAGDERPEVRRPEDPRIAGTVLCDGLVRAVWRWDGDDMVVTHFPLARPARDEVAAEGARVLALHGRSGEVKLVPAPR
jgi:DNA glycosylase AlkZ-like